MQDFYAENHKSCLKEMKENLNDVKTSHSDGKTIVKMEMLHNEIYRLNVIPIKIPKGFWGEKYKFIPTFI